MSMRPNTHNSSSDGDGDSNQASGSASGWMGWTLALLAVPVVYVLTFPPILLTVFTRGGLPIILNPPPWMRVYMKPYEWLAHRTPLHEPLTNYGTWWATQFGFRYSPMAPPPSVPPTVAP